MQYLLALTALAGYALRSCHVYSLPIPDVMSALTITLPPLAGVALETVLSLNEKLAARGQLQTSRIFQVTIAFFLVYESVLATLAGAHVSPPGSLTCALRETWKDLFKRKEGQCIERIQNAFTCCGFMTTKDMAYPFPDSTHDADACLIRYERDQACFEPWRLEERKVAIMLLVVPIAVFLWMVKAMLTPSINKMLTSEQVAIVLAPSSQSSWLPSHIRLPSDSGQSDNHAPRKPLPAIEYRDLEGQGEEDSLTRAVTGLNNDSQLALRVEGSRTKSSGLLNEAAMWREQERRENEE